MPKRVRSQLRCKPYLDTFPRLGSCVRIPASFIAEQSPAGQCTLPTRQIHTALVGDQRRCKAFPNWPPRSKFPSGWALRLHNGLVGSPEHYCQHRQERNYDRWDECAVRKNATCFGSRNVFHRDARRTSPPSAIAVVSPAPEEQQKHEDDQDGCHGILQQCWLISAGTESSVRQSVATAPSWVSLFENTHS